MGKTCRLRTNLLQCPASFFGFPFHSFLEGSPVPDLAWVFVCLACIGVGIGLTLLYQLWQKPRPLTEEEAIDVLRYLCNPQYRNERYTSPLYGCKFSHTNPSNGHEVRYEKIGGRQILEVRCHERTGTFEITEQNPASARMEHYIAELDRLALQELPVPA